MIGFVRGKILAAFKTGRNVTSLVVWPYQASSEEEFGVGYTVLVTDRQAAAYVVNNIAALWLYQVHSDNDNYYIGVESAEALKTFLQLLEVSGVGPRSAMQLIDSLGVEGVEKAIQSQDLTSLSKVPGIGKKSAAKIVLELAGKLVSLEKITMQNRGNNEFPDVVATLIKLGYTNSNARMAVEQVTEQLRTMTGADLSEKVKLVLAKAV